MFFDHAAESRRVVEMSRFFFCEQKTACEFSLGLVCSVICIRDSIMTQSFIGPRVTRFLYAYRVTGGGVVQPPPRKSYFHLLYWLETWHRHGPL